MPPPALTAGRAGRPAAQRREPVSSISRTVSPKRDSPTGGGSRLPDCSGEANPRLRSGATEVLRAAGSTVGNHVHAPIGMPENPVSGDHGATRFRRSAEGPLSPTAPNGVLFVIAQMSEALSPDGLTVLDATNVTAPPRHAATPSRITLRQRDRKEVVPQRTARRRRADPALADVAHGASGERRLERNERRQRCLCLERLALVATRLTRTSSTGSSKPGRSNLAQAPRGRQPRVGRPRPARNHELASAHAASAALIRRAVK